MPATLDVPVAEKATRGKSATDRPWLLIVFDDPVNLMSYVSMVFEKVLKLTSAEAEKKMWEVHTKGRSIVWSGFREPAEMYLQELHFYGLQAKIEKDTLND